MSDRSSAVVAMVTMLAGCTGTIGESGWGQAGDGAGAASGTRGARPGSPPGEGGDGAPEVARAPRCPDATVTLVTRRLTRDEYANTVRDLLGLEVPADVAFPVGARVAGYRNNVDGLTVSEVLAERYGEAAQKLAASATRDVSRLTGCNPSSPMLDDCVARFVDRFGARALRRPVTSAERQGLLALYTLGRSTESPTAGVRLVLEALLQSPSFLYRVEATTPEGRPWALAARLSYLFWQTMPDEELAAAAASGALETREGLAAQVDRLLASPRARASFASFHEDWLEKDRIETKTKDPRVYPELTPALRQDMIEETRRFVETTLFEREGTLAALLTAPRSYVSGNLARHYGLAASGDAWQEVALDPARRGGVLTQASVLAGHAGSADSGPIHRGVFVANRMLCNPPPPPPPDVDVTVPPPTPGVSTRERFERHRSDPACAGCHRLLDTLGLVFEHYDGLGRWRDEDNGAPVDASGELVDLDVEGPLYGAIELGQRLAASADAHACYARQWFRFALGRMEQASDECVIAALGDALWAADGDVRRFVAGLSSSPAFLSPYHVEQGGLR